MLEINDSNFGQEVLDSDKPVVVDFWADWCGPCKMIAPIFQTVSEEYSDKFKFAKVNVDDSPNITQDFSIQSVPTFLIFKNGKKAGQILGATSEASMKSTLDSLLSA